MRSMHGHTHMSNADVDLGIRCCCCCRCCVASVAAGALSFTESETGSLTERCLVARLLVFIYCAYISLPFAS